MTILQYITTYDIINNLEHIPAYFAVSYVWDQNKDEILLEKKLVDALSELGIKPHECYIWLDCYNNRDVGNYTKAMGIKDMNKVYMYAKQTIAIIPEMMQCYLKQEDIDKDFERIGNLKMSGDIVADNIVNSETQIDSSWNNINTTGAHEILKKTISYSLCDSQWMYRAWTFQEQILSKNISCMTSRGMMDITELVHDIIILRASGINCKKQLKNSIIMHILNTQSEDCIKLRSDNEVLRREVHNDFNSHGGIFGWHFDKLISQGIDHMRIKGDLITRCRNGTLSLPHAISLVADRIMGTENKDYEPMESMINYKLSYEVTMHISSFINYEKRSKYKNYCWLPSRLNTRVDMPEIRGGYVKQQKDGTLQISNITYIISRDMKNLYLEAGCDELTSTLWVHFVIISKFKQNKLHYIGILPNYMIMSKEIQGRYVKNDTNVFLIGYNDSMYDKAKVLCDSRDIIQKDIIYKCVKNI